MKYKRLKKYQEGSFTIEISLLMPFVLMVVLLTFFWLIYMYDLCVMQSVLTRGTKQVFYYVNEGNAVIEKKCSQLICSDLEESLICVEDLEVSIKVSLSNVEGEITGMLSVPEVLSWGTKDGQNMWKLSAEWKEPRLNTAKLILTGQQAKDIYDEITEGGKENGEEVQEEKIK